MKFLYIDTSSSYLYSAILNDTSIISEVKKEFGQSLSEEALPEIVKLFEDNNLEAKDIDKIIVVNGPGSFTGIRIGITIAKIFAWSLNIPIITISGLEAMMISSDKITNYVPMIDARRNYVFAAIYDKDKKVLLKPQHIKLDVLENELEKLDEYVIISNDEFETFDNIDKYNPNLLKIVNWVKNNEPINPHAVNPEYLKLTEAEESKLGW